MEKVYPYKRLPPSLRYLAAGCLGLIFVLVLPYLAKADDPNGGMVGVASNALTCLTVGDHQPTAASGVVNLAWQGEVHEARLVLKISGSEAAHTIKVNGQPVAQTPIYAEGQSCGEGQYFELTIPLEAVIQGINRIEITNDARPGDRWSAAYIRLYVLGHITAARPGQAPSTGQIGPSNITAAVSTFIITFTNSYDGSSQQAMAQIPDTYTGAPTPLVMAVHGRSSSMQWGIDAYGNAANTKGWLLASPQLHGSWPASTPGNPGYPDPDPPGKYAYASLQSQYDVVGTVKYMVEHYNVTPDRIYLVGESMGSQVNTVVMAKYPHLFAALFDNKGPTDMYAWYYEQVTYYGTEFNEPIGRMREECHIGGVPKNPIQNPFCYQRRSSLNFASNYVRIPNFGTGYASVPISITHTVGDQLVPITHSHNLRNAINSYGPVPPISIYEDPTSPDDGSPAYHGYQPDPLAVLNFFEPFRLDNTPVSINITSDESKSFYWLKITKTDAEQFSHVEVNVTGQTVTATIADTTTVQLGFNLGSTPMTDIIAQPGLGLPAGQYLVSGGGNNQVVTYCSGYLNVNVSSATIPYTVTISSLPGQPSACIYLPIVLK